MATGTHDLTKTVPLLASALGMPLESVALYCRISPTQLRRWLSGVRGSTEKLKAVHEELQRLERFRNRCPIGADFRRVGEFQELQRRVKNGEIGDLIRDVRAGLNAIADTTTEELTQAERDQITAAFAPCPVSFDDPQKVRALLAEIRDGQLIIGVSAFGQLRLVGAGMPDSNSW